MTRDERLAANEARFREINEGTRALTPGEPESIFCECSDRSCVYRLEVDPEKYREVRADDRLFLIRPGHELPEIETVVERADNYFVVRKPDEVAHVVEQ